MIRPLSERERLTLNLEQPGARITTDLQAENGPHEKFRYWAIRDRVLVAQHRAEYYHQQKVNR